MNEEESNLNQSDSEENDSNGEENVKVDKVFSSTERDPKKAIEYWTKDKIDKAKPIPFPNKETKED